MQGFFGKPVDNLYAEPLIARWIQRNVPNWADAVVVSKNPGGTKRVTSLADVLKLNFGIVTMDKRRGNMSGSMIMDGRAGSEDTSGSDLEPSRAISTVDGAMDGEHPSRQVNGVPHSNGSKGLSAPSFNRALSSESDDTRDGRAQDVITGRLVYGQLVDDNYPNMTPPMSGSTATFPADRFSELGQEPMMSSMISASSQFSGTAELASGMLDGEATSEEEEETFDYASPEQMITLVGNVKGKTVFIVDDIIDKARSWIAAAETVIKRGGAKKVFCIATHGLFGGDCLEEMEKCDCIDHVRVRTRGGRHWARF